VHELNVEMLNKHNNHNSEKGNI